MTKAMTQPKPIKVVVATDLHLMAPALMIREGSAFQRVLDSDRKLLVESECIFDALISEIEGIGPDLVLIPGDLTKDGELISHELMAQKLGILKDKGIKCCVIPGNHDINNPQARYYNGDEYTPTERVTPQDFERIYLRFGYDPKEIISRGPNLSYVAQPLSDMWVMGVDSCLYQDNIELNYPTPKGAISTETLQWMVEMSAKAKEADKQLVVMMHHNLLEHFPFQSVIASEYVVRDWVHVASVLSDAGIKVVFTGHFHAQNIVGKRFRNGLIYDVETGSIVTYPCPYREVDFTPNELTITTHYLSLPLDQLNGKTLQEYAYNHLKEGIPGMAKYLANYTRINHPDIYSEDKVNMILEMVPAFTPLIMDIYTGHLAGDQSGLRYNPNHNEVEKNPMSGDLFQQLKRFISYSSPKLIPIFDVIEGILHSGICGDNNLVLQLSRK